MTKSDECTQELRSVPQLAELPPPKKIYDKPLLREWGSILELTGGPKADIQDDDFSGSNGV
jgi:hypothetical protein